MDGENLASRNVDVRVSASVDDNRVAGASGVGRAARRHVAVGARWKPGVHVLVDAVVGDGEETLIASVEVSL